MKEIKNKRRKNKKNKSIFIVKNLVIMLNN